MRLIYVVLVGARAVLLVLGRQWRASDKTAFELGTQIPASLVNLHKYRCWLARPTWAGPPQEMRKHDDVSEAFHS